MRNKAFLAVVAAASIGLVAAYAEPKAEKSSDEESIRTLAERYQAAFDGGDLDSLLSMWSDDADYVDLDGNSHRGKAAVSDMFKSSLEDLKGYHLDVKIESLRMVRPEVAIEDGTTTLTSPDGETTSSRYMAVLVKSGDQWRIQSGRELAADEHLDSSAGGSVLEPLESLIGSWSSEDKGPVVSLTNKWALNKNFVMQEYTVAGKSGDDLQVVQWIGLDPLSGQIKSWSFDSSGGHSEGFWTRDANSLIGKSRGVLPDGRVGTADNTLSFVDDTHMEWRSTGRNVDGQPMPDVEVKFVRKPPTEKVGTP